MAAVGGAVPADVRGVALGIATLVFLVGGGVGSAVVGGIGEVARPGPQPAAARAAAARGLPGAGGHDPGGAGPLLSRPGAPADPAPASVAGHAADRPRAPAAPRASPTVSPDGRMAVVAVDPPRPRRRRVPQPAVGGAHRRLRPGPADHAPGTATARRPSRPTAAGWPTSAPSPAASRRSTCCPRPVATPAGYRPPPRRRARRSGRRTPAGWPTPRGCPSTAGTAPSRASGPGPSRPG